MFTGIVENRVKILTLEGKILKITNPWKLNELATGQSISLSGCCLTVVHFDQNSIQFDVSPETLARTKFSALKLGDDLNVERGLRMGGAMDGHWVTGHIDTTGIVKTITKLSDGMLNILFEVSNEYTRWLVEKGSVAIDGVSLTVNAVTANTFSVVLIPHTLEVTSLKNLRMGSIVNVEFDLFAKYVERLLEQRNPKQMEAR